jgi:atrial natriuretic peptide receptor A
MEWNAVMLLQVGSALRSSMVSLSSQVDLDLRQVFTQVGTHKGTIVAVKRLNKKCVDLTRSVRKELKQVRTLQLTMNLNSEQCFHE